MGQGLPRNQVEVPPVKPRPTQEQMTADLLASGQPIQPVQPAQPGPVDNLLQGLGGGAKAVLEGFGDFVNKQKETPEGRLLLTNLLAGVTVGLGADPAIGANIVQQGQEQFKLGVAREEKQADRQFQLDVLGAKEKTAQRQADTKRKQDLEDYRLKKEIDLDVKAQADEPRQKNTAKNIISSNERLINNIDELLDDPGLGTATGKSGFATGLIPGSKAYDIRSNIKTLTANQAFQTLQAIRDASKTGGALGQVSERELDLLEKTVASLDPNQSDKQFKKNLIKFRDVLGKTSAKYSQEVLNEPYEYEKYKPKKDSSSLTDGYRLLGVE